MEQATNITITTVTPTRERKPFLVEGNTLKILFSQKNGICSVLFNVRKEQNPDGGEEARGRRKKRRRRGARSGEAMEVTESDAEREDEGEGEDGGVVDLEAHSEDEGEEEGEPEESRPEDFEVDPVEQEPLEQVPLEQEPSEPIEPEVREVPDGAGINLDGFEPIEEKIISDSSDVDVPQIAPEEEEAASQDTEPEPEVRRGRRSGRKRKERKETKKSDDEEEEEGEEEEEREPEQVKMIKPTGRMEIEIKGELCHEITSPFITFTLLVTKQEGSTNRYILNSIANVSSPAEATPLTVKRIVGRSYYFGNPTETSRMRGNTAMKHFRVVLDEVGIDAKTNLCLDDVRKLSNEKYGSVAAVFKNVLRGLSYFELANKLGSSIISDMDDNEVSIMKGTGTDVTDDQKITLFERLCFDHRFTDEQAAMFFPIREDAIKKIKTLHMAYTIYHDLLDQKKHYGNTILYEKEAVKWDDEAFELLASWQHLVHTDIASGSTSRGPVRIVQLNGDRKTEQELAKIMAGYVSITILDYIFDIDPISREDHSYFMRLKEILPQDNSDVIVVCSLNRRCKIVSLNAFNNTVKCYKDACNQPITTFTRKKAEDVPRIRGINTGANANANAKEKPRKPQLSLAKKIIAFGDNPLSDLSKAQKTPTTLMIDRTHFLSNEELLKLLKCKGSYIKRLILGGSKDCQTEKNCTVFHELSKGGFDMVNVIRPHLLYPFDCIKNNTKGFYNTIEDVLEDIPENQPANIYVTRAAKKTSYRNIVKQAKKQLLVSVFTIWDFNVEDASPYNIVIDLDDCKLSSLVRALHCSSNSRHNSIYFIGTRDKIDEIFSSGTNTKSGNFGTLFSNEFVYNMTEIDV